MAETQKHTVQPGDTLGAIAKKFNTSINNISGFKSGNRDLIFPNEILTIDSGASQVPTSLLNNTKDTVFNEKPGVPEPVIPEFNFTEKKAEQSTVTEEIEKLRRRQGRVLEKGEKRLGDLIPDQQRLGTVQAQLDALKTQRTAIPQRVGEEFQGGRITEQALRNQTSQELRRNSILQADFAAEGSLLQGNIRTALDLIETATDLELAPIERDLTYAEDNLDSLISTYNDEVDSYSKRIVAEAKVEKEKITEERRQLEDVRKLRTDLRLISNSARSGGASSSVVAAIMRAGSYEEAIRLASGFLDLTEAEKAKKNTFPDTDTDTSDVDELTGLLDRI